MSVSDYVGCMIDSLELRAVLILACSGASVTAKRFEPTLEEPLWAAAEAFNLLTDTEPDKMRAIARRLTEATISVDGLESPLAAAVPFIARSLHELADDLVLAHR